MSSDKATNLGRDIARRIIEGAYDEKIRRRFVKKGALEGDPLSGYLTGVKKSIALLLYAAEKDDWVRLTEATNRLFISRSSAHKLIQRKLKKNELVEIEKQGKWMVYRLTPKGKKVVEDLIKMFE